jgi:hypothetical protein
VPISYASRSYAGAADLRRMQEAVARAYRITSLRVGDLAWLTRYHTHRELSLDIRLWENGRGEIVGWTFFRAFGGFNVFVAPGRADDPLLDELLNEIDAAARASLAAGDPPVRLYTYGIDLSRSAEDGALAAALERHRFVQSPRAEGVLTRALDVLPDPAPPARYRLGWVRTRGQAIGRVEAQRAAFAPSDFLLERYERVRRTCSDALRALHQAGAKVAQVGFATDAAYATYRSIGFELSATEVVFRRDPP